MYSHTDIHMQSQRYWEMRYLLLPKQPPLLPPFHTGSDRISQQKELLINNFVRFLEFLNHIKRGGAKNFVSERGEGRGGEERSGENVGMVKNLIKEMRWERCMYSMYI